MEYGGVYQRAPKAAMQIDGCPMYQGWQGVSEYTSVHLDSEADTVGIMLDNGFVCLMA